MSEALTKPLPQDFPAVDTPATRINIRKAMAGLRILNGEGSVMRCLIASGYSRATARIQTQAGLSAESCIAEACKLDERANPANLLAAARSRAMLAIESVDPKTVRLGDAMKMLDTAEKFYGGHEISPSSVALNVADRLAQVVALLVEAKQRGLPVPALPESFTDAEVVATRSESREMSTASVELTPDGTTR